MNVGEWTCGPQLQMGPTSRPVENYQVFSLRLWLIVERTLLNDVRKSKQEKILVFSCSQALPTGVCVRRATGF